MKNNQDELILKNYGSIFTIEDKNGRIVKTGFNKKNPTLDQFFNKKEGVK